MAKRIKKPLPMGITQQTLNVIEFYCKVAGIDFTPSIVNEKYAKYGNVTQEQCDAIIQSLKERLKKRESDAITLYYGLKDGKRFDGPQVATLCFYSVVRFYQLKRQAFNKLKRYNNLPQLYGFTFKKADIKETDPLEALELSGYIIRFLKLDGIYTVADVLNYPKQSWIFLSHLSKKSKIKVEQCIRNVYGDETFFIPY